MFLLKKTYKKHNNRIYIHNFIFLIYNYCNITSWYNFTSPHRKIVYKNNLRDNLVIIQTPSQIEQKSLNNFLQC